MRSRARSRSRGALTVGLELAAETFGGLPNLVGEVVEFGLIEDEGHRMHYRYDNT